MARYKSGQERVKALLLGCILRAAVSTEDRRRRYCIAKYISLLMFIFISYILRSYFSFQPLLTVLACYRQLS